MNDIPCLCCGSLVLSNYGLREICPVCGWQDDPVQSTNENFAGGANELSLCEARKNWLRRVQDSTVS